MSGSHHVILLKRSYLMTGKILNPIKHLLYFFSRYVILNNVRPRCRLTICRPPRFRVGRFLCWHCLLDFQVRRFSVANNGMGYLDAYPGIWSIKKKTENSIWFNLSLSYCVFKKAILNTVIPRPVVGDSQWWLPAYGGGQCATNSIPREKV